MQATSTGMFVDTFLWR